MHTLQDGRLWQLRLEQSCRQLATFGNGVPTIIESTADRDLMHKEIRGVLEALDYVVHPS